MAHFGDGNVFLDAHDIPLGINFRAYIVGVLAKCSAVLTIIGPEWATARDEAGNLRLQNPDDLLRVEIEVALTLGQAVVVPIFVSGATMLDRNALPDTLRELASREGHLVRRDPDFMPDMDRLVERLNSRLN